MRSAAAIALVALIALAAAHPARATPTITMSGADVTEALVADLAYFYRHAVLHPPRFDLTGGVTGTGIADTERGIVDGGLVVRDLEAGDPPGLVITPLALSGVCLVTNRANPVPALSRAQVQDIVAGRITRWSEVPGSRRTDAIVPVALNATTGTGAVFLSTFVDDDTPMGYQPITLLDDLQARDFITQTPAAFGYADRALTGPLHAVAYEGVPCTRVTIRNGTYPAARPLGIVTRGRPRGPLARFLRWARTSRRARAVIETRYVATPTTSSG